MCWPHLLQMFTLHSSLVSPIHYCLRNSGELHFGNQVHFGFRSFFNWSRGKPFEFVLGKVSRNSRHVSLLGKWINEHAAKLGCCLEFSFKNTFWSYLFFPPCFQTRCQDEKCSFIFTCLLDSTGNMFLSWWRRKTMFQLPSVRSLPSVQLF